ncbi:MAG: hypothetical protein ACYTKD_31940, partial [Planctomycetota bacterium]
GTLPTASARAQGGPRSDEDAPPVTDVPAAGEPLTVYDAPQVGDPSGDAEVGRIAERLDRLESRLERLEEKLDGLEALLRTVHGERLRRAEMLASDPALADAVRNLAERYGVARADEYLIADESARVGALAKKLARTSAERGPLEFCSDPDVAQVVGAIAGRRDYMAESGHRLVVSIAGREGGAAGALVVHLLDLPSPDAHEAAMWGAPFAERDGLGERLSRFAADLEADANGDDARLALLARAAAAAHGDRAAEDAMAKLVRSGAVDGAVVLRVASNLRTAGSVVALRAYLELVLDEKYSYAAAQAFSSIDGFGRVIGWREVKDGRPGLRDELADWLRRNRSKLRADRGRFRVADEEERP